MLERGWRAVWHSGGKTNAFELISIGERAYAPLSLLGTLGWETAENVGSVRVKPPAGL